MRGAVLVCGTHSDAGKSLVVAGLSGERMRYHFLESTRDYALEKLLESGT